MMAILAAIGSILLFLLKVLLALIGIVLALIVLLILVPISVYVDYENQQWLVKLRILGVRFRVYPIPKWLERFFQEPEPEYHTPSGAQPTQPQHREPVMDSVESQPPPNPQPEPPQMPKQVVLEKAEPIHQTTTQPPQKEEVPKQEAPRQEPQKQEQTKQAPPTPPKTEKQPPLPQQPKVEPSTIEKVVALLKTATGAAKIALKGIWVSVWVRWPIQGKDAADTAISFGRWNGWLGGICAVLSNLMQFRLRKLDLIPDFAGEYQGKEKVQAKLTASPLMFLIAGIWVLKELKNKKIL